MGYTDDELNYIYDKTGGYCNWCEKKIAFRNYGRVGERGAWEVDHSNPLALGGTDYLRNLVPACIPCNRSKGANLEKYTVSVQREFFLNLNFRDFS